MKAQEIRELSSAELDSKITQIKSELFNLRFQNATNQLDNPLRIAHLRKDLARALTIKHENARKA